MTIPQDQFLDFYRSGLKATGDLIRTALEGAERLRVQQLAAINEALASHAQAIKAIDEANSIEQLIAVQGQLAGAQYQTVIGYWNGICQAAGESQADAARRVQAQSEQVREIFQKALGATPGEPVPVIAALQPLMDVASAAYALTARATEEAAKLAAAQLATANAGIAQATEQVQRKSA